MRLRITEITTTGDGPLYLRTGTCAAKRRKAAARREAYDPTPAERAILLALYGDACAYCGKPVSRGLRELTIDHCLPVARGGRTTLENAVPACRSCNFTKAARTATEWGRCDVLLRAQGVATGVDEFWRGFPSNIPAKWRGILGRMVRSRLVGAGRLR